MHKERIQWIDFASGLVVILMVLGHVMPSGNALKIMFIFHMPFFFVMAGYVLNTEKWSSNLWDFTKRLTKRLILPYFLAELIWYPIWFIFSHRLGFLTHLWGLSEADPFRAFITIFLGAINNNYESAAKAPLLLGPMWFFPCLFLAEVVFLTLYKFFGHDFKKLSGAVLIAAILGLVLGKYYPLPMSLDISLAVQVFILAGILLRAREINLLACGISLLVMCIAFTFNPSIDMSFRMYYNPILFYSGGIAGTILIIKLSMICAGIRSKISDFIAYCGFQSVIIVAVHLPVVMVVYDVVAALTPYKTQKLLQSDWLVVIFTAGAAIIIPLIIAKKFGKKPIVNYFCN